jgi:putative Mg2+ transporter-C (MgtC) family protein
MNMSWLWESWRNLWPAPWAYVAMVLATILCGIIVGSERQRRGKPAGIRAMVLVSLGSSIFTMVSVVFASNTGDSGRVAAQIVTGIGFLCGGVILQNRHSIGNVVTAASIWMVAAIGMAVGDGYVIAGLCLSILVNRLLVILLLYETKWRPGLCHVNVILNYSPNGGIARVRLERVLLDYNLMDDSVEWLENSQAEGRLTLKIRLTRFRLRDFLAALAEVPEVTSVPPPQFL